MHDLQKKNGWLFGTHSFSIYSFTSISLMTSCMRSNICWQHLTGFRRNFKALLIEIWWQGLSRSSSSGVKSLSTCNISCNFCFTLKKEGKMQEIYTYLGDLVCFPSIVIVSSSNTFVTAKRKLERHQFSTSSLFVKIWSACSCEFKAYFWIFWAL